MCAPGATTECPLSGNLDISVGYSITSENFCATVEVNVELTIAIQVYRERSFTNVNTAFIVEDTAFFQVVLDSDLNIPNDANKDNDVIKFQFTRIIEVNFIVKDKDNKNVQHTALSLYRNGITSLSVEAGIGFEIIQVSSPANEKAGFAFKITKLLINKAAEAIAGKGLAANSKFSFSINVVAQVGYTDDNPGVAKRKRLIEGIQFALAEAGSDKSSAGQSTEIEIADADLSSTVITSSTVTNTGTNAGTGTETGKTSSAAQLIMGLVTLMFALMF
jgi:hypothetical protein